MQKDILTFKEFIDYCGISKSLGYKLTSGKKIPFYKPNNGKIYFKKKDVDQYLLNNKIESIGTFSQDSDLFL